MLKEYYSDFWHIGGIFAVNKKFLVQIYLEDLIDNEPTVGKLNFHNSSFELIDKEVGLPKRFFPLKIKGEYMYFVRDEYFDDNLGKIIPLEILKYRLDVNAW